MKRKIIAIVMTLLMLLGAVGCSTEGLNLYEEMKKTSAWEAAESTGNVLVTAEVEGELFELGADFSGYANTEESQAYIEMNINTVNLSNMGIDVDFSPVKMYIDGQIIYISKTYFTDLMQVSGADLPEALDNIDAEYIGIDVSTGTQTALFDQKSAMALTDVLFKDSKVKMPITQSGRTYTIDLDADQMVDLSVEFIKEMMNNIDAINKLSDTGLTQKDIDENKEEFEMSLEEGKEMVKPMLDGSQATLKYAFEDNTYKEDMDIALKLKVEEEVINFNIVLNADSKKIAKKEFKLPESKVLYTMEELMGLLMSSTVKVSSEDVSIAEITLDKVVTKDETVYIPLRETMDQLGSGVKYDAKTKQVMISTGDSEVVVNVMIQQGASYIALSELEKLGFYVIEDENGIVVISE